MVASITEGTAFDKHGRPFRRRNHVPVLCLFLALALVTGVVWVIALNQSTEVQEAVACNPPPPAANSDASQPVLGEQVSPAEMAEVMPARLADAKVQVLNASGQGGQAAEVSGALRDLGFAQPAAANDALYANSRLECQGQLRFGETGKAAAAAVWLVAPCTELYLDGRTDDTVDFAVGTEFSEFSRSDDIDAMLAGLRPDATAPADATLLTKIHGASC
ncbi:MAG: envelope integrity protein Cei [Mycobacterium sp.]